MASQLRLLVLLKLFTLLHQHVTTSLQVRDVGTKKLYNECKFSIYSHRFIIYFKNYYWFWKISGY